MEHRVPRCDEGRRGRALEGVSAAGPSPGPRVPAAHHTRGETEAQRDMTGSGSPRRSPAEARREFSLCPRASQRMAVGPHHRLPEPGAPAAATRGLWPQKPLRSVSAAPGPRETRPRPAAADRLRVCPTLRLIRPPFSSRGFLAAFKLSHKIYLLFHEYISSRQAQAFYIFTLYIFHGRLIAVSKAERAGEPADGAAAGGAGGGGRRGAAGRRVPWCPRPRRPHWPWQPRASRARAGGTLHLGPSSWERRQGRGPGV